MSKDPMKIADALRRAIQEKMPYEFEMEWEGSKVPRGAKVGGIEVVWTQHGMITGRVGGTSSVGESIDLGTYERIEEFGGASGKRHKIRIGTKYDSATNPNGSPCKAVVVDLESRIPVMVRINEAGALLKKGGDDGERAFSTLSEIADNGNYSDSKSAFMALFDFALHGNPAPESRSIL